jgi:hypothetical protein
MINLDGERDKTLRVGKTPFILAYSTRLCGPHTVGDLLGTRTAVEPGTEETLGFLPFLALPRVPSVRVRTLSGIYEKHKSMAQYQYVHDTMA